MTITLHHTFRGHDGKVWETSCSGKFPLLASVSSDKTCRIYNLDTKELVTVLDEKNHKKTVRAVAWKNGSDYPLLALGSFDATVSIWGIEDDSYEDYTTTFNEESRGEWELMLIIEGHENEIKSVSWNSSGDLLATCSRDKTVWLWECDESNEEFECINVLQEHTQDVKCCRFHPFEQLLLSSSYDDTIRLYKQDIYDDDDWVCVSELTGHTGTVWSIDFEKNEDAEVVRLCSCSDDSTVKIWNRVTTIESRLNDIPSTIKADSSEEWQLQLTLPEIHERQIYACSWSAHSGKIASVGSDGKIVIYKETVQDGINSKWEIEQTHELSHSVYEINSCEWWYNSKEDSEYLITGGDDGIVNMWLID